MRFSVRISLELARETGLEPPTSSSRTLRVTNCATARQVDKLKSVASAISCQRTIQKLIRRRFGRRCLFFIETRRTRAARRHSTHWYGEPGGPQFNAVSMKKKRIGETGLEPATSCSQRTRATNCATPRLRKGVRIQKPAPTRQVHLRSRTPLISTI